MLNFKGEIFTMQQHPTNVKNMTRLILSVLVTLPMFFVSCFLTPSGPEDPPPVTKPVVVEGDCIITEDFTPAYTTSIGCKNDFKKLASQPMDASIPGATSAKTIIDLSDTSKPLYIIDSKTYPIHYEFASKKLSGIDKPIVPELGEFNKNYYNNSRRFILGAISYYEEPDAWVYEIAPYDKATADMITLAYEKIKKVCYFGNALYFHPSSEAVATVAKSLPSSVKIITTEELYKGITYQPLNCTKSIGKLVFIKAAELDSSYLSFRDIPVLDAVPNDISVTMGIITQEFQTPLAHINVLSHNRGTPNMALRNAWNDPALRALNGKWVELTVESFKYTITEVTEEVADEWWKDNGPAEVGIPNLDTNTRDLRNVEDILDVKNMTVFQAIKAALPAFGGKTTHFSAFPKMDPEKVTYPKAFGIPIYYYIQFMKQNGFDLQVAEMLADPAFKNDPKVRDDKLKKLRKQMEKAPVDAEFTKMLTNKLNTDFPGVRMRFRSSTNAEDLDGFTGAGLYTSNSGGPNDMDDVLNAIRKVWASVWYFRAFEERSYRKIDHMAVGMALLAHQAFPTEEATGVAITTNIFDESGSEPGFYVNVQYNGASVVLPDSGVTTDQFIYHYEYPGQPIVYIGHSNQLPPGRATVLTAKQVRALGDALDEIHSYFKNVYGTDDSKPFAMDTEFKFDQPLGSDSTAEPILMMKQCRPYY
jgi:pyruvate, water dikinase